jgi:regulator of sigma E protease
MTTLLAFIVTIGILVVVHEFGHYAVARWCGIKVLRFSIGFGNIIARRTDRHGTEWALSTIPLGGYVKMLDEREGAVAPEDLPYAFNRKPVWQRMATVVAGPLSNLLLAILLYWLLFVFGITVLKPIVATPEPNTPAAAAGLKNGDLVLAVNGEAVEDWQAMYWGILKHGMDDGEARLETRSLDGRLASHTLNLTGIDLADVETDPMARVGLTSYMPDFPAIIGQLVPGGRAAQAGMQAKDKVTAIDGKPVSKWTEMVDIVRASPGKPLRFTLLRDGKPLEISVTPDDILDSGKQVGRIGAAPYVDEAQLAFMRGEVRFGPLVAAKRALYKTWDLSTFSVEMMAKLLTGQASLKNLSGPVTIADYAGRSAEAGLSVFIGFLALVSVSLGVLNLLPIPILDGGHLLYYFAELLIGRPVPDSVQEVAQKIGAALLGALMILALFNDLHRLLAG